MLEYYLQSFCCKRQSFLKSISNTSGCIIFPKFHIVPSTHSWCQLIDVCTVQGQTRKTKMQKKGSLRIGTFETRNKYSFFILLLLAFMFVHNLGLFSHLYDSKLLFMGTFTIITRILSIHIISHNSQHSSHQHHHKRKYFAVNCSFAVLRFSSLLLSSFRFVGNKPKS